MRWDPQLGGQTMESRLVEHFADEFNKQLGTGFDVRKSPKAMAKLKKQVKRTKEILSANTMAPISVESLYDDRDFRYVKLEGHYSFFSYCDMGLSVIFVPMSSKKISYSPKYVLGIRNFYGETTTGFWSKGHSRVILVPRALSLIRHTPYQHLISLCCRNARVICSDARMEKMT